MSGSRESGFCYRKDKLCFTDYDPQFMSVCFITSGHVSLCVNGTFLYVAAPHIICFNADQKVELLSAFRLSAISVSFSFAFLNLKITSERVKSEAWHEISEEQSFPALQAFRENVYSYHRVLPIDTWIQPIAKNLFMACATESFKISDDRGCQTRTPLLLLLKLVDILYRRYFSAERHSDPEVQLLQDAIDHIQLNFMQDIDLTELYKIAQVNRNKFNQLFLKRMGTTVSDYITKCRIRYAKELLASTSKSIGYISEKSGYKYASYFVRVFKKETGITPDTFRAKKILGRIHL